ncbi:MAG: type II toxin-antitoxin system death-on-curing family toxin [Acidobacteria bacterium]|jgi:death-on-curing protein|nr:type II toxin-antitoxin system death-on-curing family toxin [Acidobacteriota bacterium]
MPFLFPRKQEVLDIHARLIEAFGGTRGLRDEGALESALAAADNRQYYETADLATCAATYAYHLSQAHAFIDGNKRIAAAISEIFLELNSARLDVSNEQLVTLFLNIAAGKLSRDEVDGFFKQWTVFES